MLAHHFFRVLFFFVIFRGCHAIDHWQSYGTMRFYVKSLTLRSQRPHLFVVKKSCPSNEINGLLLWCWKNAINVCKWNLTRNRIYVCAVSQQKKGTANSCYSNCNSLISIAYPSTQYHHKYIHWCRFFVGDVPIFVGIVAQIDDFFFINYTPTSSRTPYAMKMYEWTITIFR